MEEQGRGLEDKDDSLEAYISVGHRVWSRGMLAWSGNFGEIGEYDKRKNAHGPWDVGAGRSPVDEVVFGEVDVPPVKCRLVRAMLAWVEVGAMCGGRIDCKPM